LLNDCSIGGRHAIAFNLLVVPRGKLQVDNNIQAGSAAPLFRVLRTAADGYLSGHSAPRHGPPRVLYMSKYGIAEFCSFGTEFVQDKTSRRDRKHPSVSLVELDAHE
jgi:hypothetical protein